MRIRCGREWALRMWDGLRFGVLLDAKNVGMKRKGGVVLVGSNWGFKIAMMPASHLPRGFDESSLSTLSIYDISVFERTSPSGLLHKIPPRAADAIAGLGHQSLAFSLRASSGGPFFFGPRGNSNFDAVIVFAGEREQLDTGSWAVVGAGLPAFGFNARK